MLTVDFAILDLATARREHLLRKAWEIARANIEAGSRADLMLMWSPRPERARRCSQRLRMAGVEVRRAKQSFTAGEKSYARGTWVIPAGQAFRGYVLDLMEPQHYPELRAGISGPTKRPYDVAGWTMPMLMGVAFDRVEKPFDADWSRLNRSLRNPNVCRPEVAADRDL